MYKALFDAAWGRNPDRARGSRRDRDYQSPRARYIQWQECSRNRVRRRKADISVRTSSQECCGDRPIRISDSICKEEDSKESGSEGKVSGRKRRTDGFSG